MKVFKVFLSIVFAIMFVTIFSVVQASDVATKKSQRQVMHDFMKILAEESHDVGIGERLVELSKENVLDKATISKTAVKNLDNAIKKSSNGLFEDTKDLVEKFKLSLKNSEGDSIENTLLRVCGIDLLNDDTGAITGKDAGGNFERNSFSIIPEPENTGYIELESVKSQIPNDKFIVVKGLENVWLKRNGILPDLLMYFKNHNLTVKVDNYFSENLTLNENEKIAIDGLYNWWIEESLNLVKESYGIDFNSPTSKTNEMTLVNNYNPMKWDKKNPFYVSNIVSSTNLTMAMNIKYYGKLDLSTKLGKNGRPNEFSSFKINDNPDFWFLDRVVSHEMTHAVMAANIKGFWELPCFVKEGIAELTHGVDDVRRPTIIKLLENYYSGGKYLEGALQNNMNKISIREDKTYIDDSQYATGYMLLRYFAKQVADASIPVVPDISTNETEMLKKLVGVYKGSYFAGQDEVGTTLTIFEDIDGTFKAVWDFYNLSNKTNFYEGNTRCHVKYDAKTRMYSVQSYEWIDRKLNYPFLTLSGRLNGNIFSGDHQYKFTVTRVN